MAQHPDVYPCVKKTLVSIGAVATTAATPVSAAVVHYSSAVTLNSQDELWYLDGGSSGLMAAARFTSSSPSTYGIETRFESGAKSKHLVLNNDEHMVPTGSPSTPYTSVGGSVVTSSLNDIIYDGSQNYMSVASDFPNYMYRFNNPGDLVENLSSTPQYVMFSFQYNDSIVWSTQYGWALVSVTGSMGSFAITFDEWAYTTAGESIYVGQTSSVPEPASTAGGLGLLALGAAGMSRYLKNRRQRGA